jgi:hypothetical protein
MYANAFAASVQLLQRATIAKLAAMHNAKQGTSSRLARAQARMLFVQQPYIWSATGSH